MHKNDLYFAFDEVVKDYPVVYDLGITTIPESFYDYGHKYQRHFKRLKVKNVKSVIVWNIFSVVSFDYAFRDIFIPKIINKLNLKFNRDKFNFDYDHYQLNRKQFAVRSGTAKISRPSIAFHEKFGLNYKIDLIFTNGLFDDAVVIEDKLEYENCIGCDAPCESSCPVGCTFNYEHSDWRKCDNFITTAENFSDPEKMCRICQDACPYSEDLKQKLLDINPDYGSRIPNKIDYARGMLKK